MAFQSLHASELDSICNHDVVPAGVGGVAIEPGANAEEGEDGEAAKALGSAASRQAVVRSGSIVPEDLRGLGPDEDGAVVGALGGSLLSQSPTTTRSHHHLQVLGGQLVGHFCGLIQAVGAEDSKAVVVQGSLCDPGIVLEARRVLQAHQAFGQLRFDLLDLALAGADQDWGRVHVVLSLGQEILGNDVSICVGISNDGDFGGASQEVDADVPSDKGLGCCDVLVARADNHVARGHAARDTGSQSGDGVGATDEEDMVNLGDVGRCQHQNSGLGRLLVAGRKAVAAAGSGQDDLLHSGRSGCDCSHEHGAGQRVASAGSVAAGNVDSCHTMATCTAASLELVCDTVALSEGEVADALGSSLQSGPLLLAEGLVGLLHLGLSSHELLGKGFGASWGSRLQLAELLGVLHEGGGTVLLHVGMDAFGDLQGLGVDSVPVQGGEFVSFHTAHAGTRSGEFRLASSVHGRGCRGGCWCRRGSCLLGRHKLCLRITSSARYLHGSHVQYLLDLLQSASSLHQLHQREEDDIGALGDVLLDSGGGAQLGSLLPDLGVQHLGVLQEAVDVALLDVGRHLAAVLRRLLKLLHPCRDRGAELGQALGLHAEAGLEFGAVAVAEVALLLDPEDQRVPIAVGLDALQHLHAATGSTLLPESVP
mmetsp:Transcript_17789/g.38088  ORF Transcript_17789/g.38088 Transcript_17789/m.38088 type:complete len:651 (-) Transcript_17789:1605-3557(-)